jgi:hypothetical protein
MISATSIGSTHGFLQIVQHRPNAKAVSMRCLSKLLKTVGVCSLLPLAFAIPMDGQDAATASATVSPANGSVQRDPQALSILTQAIARAGGTTLLSSIQAIEERGSITYSFGDQVTAEVMVKTRGMHQLRIEADLSAGKRTTIINGDHGLLKDETGRISSINDQGDTDVGVFTLPYLTLNAAIQDTSCGVTFGGLVTHDGVAAYDIRLSRNSSKKGRPTGSQEVREVRDFYIEPDSFHVVALSDQFHVGRGPLKEDVSHEVQYSDYQTESAIPVPMTITEVVRGEASFKMHFSQVTFNPGVLDSDFAQ